MGGGILKLVVGLVIGLIAGVGIGLLVAPDRTAPQYKSPPEPVQAAAPQPAAQAPVERPPEPASSPRTLQDIIAATDVPPVPSGNAAIAGVVLMEDGEPLPGVRVTAASQYPSTTRLSDLSGEDRVRADIRRARWNELARHTATTGDDGRYSIEGLAEDARYFVQAELPGWSVRREGSSSGWVNNPPAERNFVARAEVEVAVTVLMPDGSVAREALVVGRSDTIRGQRTARTRANGIAQVRLTPGTWTIHAVRGFSNEYRSDEVQVTFERGDIPEPFMLQLKETPGIKGRVEVPAGFTPPRIWVRARMTPPG
jgi:hypothetical protein